MTKTRVQGLLLDLCAISSESGNAAGLRSVAARLTPELERHGLSVEIVEERDAHGELQPVLLARGPGAADGHLLLVGHMDTVLPAVPPKVEGGRLLATGALDMKGGLAMLVGALDTLAATGLKPPPDLLLVAVPDEESEGAISAAAMRRWSEKARAVLVLEAGMRVRGNGETLVTGRRGLTEWTLDADREGGALRPRLLAGPVRARRRRRLGRARAEVSPSPGPAGRSTSPASSPATPGSWAHWARTRGFSGRRASSTSSRTAPSPRANSDT
jgi:acetylornithine deacetylase/succinyl-diaminopimelate desuccinylase-like protein